MWTMGSQSAARAVLQEQYAPAAYCKRNKKTASRINSLAVVGPGVGCAGGIVGVGNVGVIVPGLWSKSTDTASPISKLRVGVGKKKRKRRSHIPHAPEVLPVCPDKHILLWSGDKPQKKPAATEMMYKLKIKRVGEEDLDDLFH
ncbi:hypothetical protein R1sor_024947 [Riccia sorocarpa]|uniref:Uncharacterized protein n=1 Tax=Riccia sorocarpa TaxID=122646 RepID=A0ABD3G959_9MARC